MMDRYFEWFCRPLGNSLASMLFVQAALQADKERALSSPSYTASIPAIAILVSELLILAPRFGGATCLVQFSLVVFACSLTLALVAEARALWLQREIHFHLWAYKFHHSCNNTNFSAIKGMEQLQTVVNQYRYPLICLAVLAPYLQPIFREDAFWPGLVQTILFRDFSYYYFTGVFDLVTVVATMLVAVWCCQHAILRYWIKKVGTPIRKAGADVL